MFQEFRDEITRAHFCYVSSRLQGSETDADAARLLDLRARCVRSWRKAKRPKAIGEVVVYARLAFRVDRYQG